MRELHGLETLVPSDEEQELIHRIIYEELCRDKVLPESRSVFIGIIERLVQRGAQGLVLGCTEIMLLVGQEDSPIHVFDTTELHARRAVELALGL